MDESNKKNMTIGILAKHSSVGVETIRFYQRKGLLLKPDKVCGFRKYSESDVRKIKFIKGAQKLGFSLSCIQDLLDLSFCESKTQPYLKKICDHKMLEIEEKISDLNAMKKMLRNFQQSCGNKKHYDAKCDLLTCFENKWHCCQK